jgi:hypothetical protein
VENLCVCLYRQKVEIKSTLACLPGFKSTRKFLVNIYKIEDGLATCHYVGKK